MEVSCSPDLTSEQRKSILNLLDQYLPNTTIWAFGSRSNWTSHAKSDLDLVAFASENQKHQVALLDDAFQESDLPFKIDLSIWEELSDEFKAQIKAQYVVLKRKKRKSEDGWLNLPFSKAVQLNPSVKLKRGECYQYVDMATISPQNPDVSARTSRKYLGSGSRFQDGDVLMARITPCLENGKIAYFKSNRLTSKFSVGHGSTEFIVIRGRPGITDTKFAYYLAQWESVRSYAIDQMTGTSGRQRVPIECFDHKFVVVPPIPEQHRITSILSAFDDKIEKNRLMNKTLEEMARVLFKSWFIDFEPVRAKMAERNTGLPKHIDDLFPDRLVDSELGAVPKGWEVGFLRDVAVFPRRVVNPAENFNDTPYVGLKHMPRRSIALTDWEVLDNVKSNKFAFCEGEILFGKLRPYFHKVGLAPFDGVCSTDIVVVTPKFATWSAFLLCLVSSTEFVKYTDRTSTGTKMPRTSWQTMSQYEFCLPTESIVQIFQEIVGLMLQHVSTNILVTCSLTELRNTLLPKLISGEIRLRDAEKITEAVA